MVHQTTVTAQHFHCTAAKAWNEWRYHGDVRATWMVSLASWKVNIRDWSATGSIHVNAESHVEKALPQWHDQDLLRRVGRKFGGVTGSWAREPAFLSFFQFEPLCHFDSHAPTAAKLSQGQSMATHQPMTLFCLGSWTLVLWQLERQGPGCQLRKTASRHHSQSNFSGHTNKFDKQYFFCTIYELHILCTIHQNMFIHMVCVKIFGVIGAQWCQVDVQDDPFVLQDPNSIWVTDLEPPDTRYWYCRLCRRLLNRFQRFEHCYGFSSFIFATVSREGPPDGQRFEITVVEAHPDLCVTPLTGRSPN